MKQFLKKILVVNNKRASFWKKYERSIALDALPPASRGSVEFYCCTMPPWYSSTIVRSSAVLNLVLCAHVACSKMY